MSTSPSPTPPDADVFVCECNEWHRSACNGEFFYKEHNGTRYCVLHYPGIEKKEDFQKALERKLSAGNFDFRGVWFPDEVFFQNFTFNVTADFSGARFSAAADFIGARFGADADFKGARFSMAADFKGAQFSAAADFRHAQFHAIADFSEARFSAIADFSGARFSATAKFDDAVFNGNAEFRRTKFIEKGSSSGRSINHNNKAISPGDRDRTKANISKVYFDGARFKDGVRFEENMFAGQSLLSFSAAVFEKPERVSFHTVALRPRWFVNVDSRKFNFITVDWGLLDRQDAVREEIKALGHEQTANKPRLLALTFRQLAVNAEENNRYEEAANFRYMAMEVGRIERGLIENLFSLRWWYWALSGYGERVQRAFAVLLVIWLLFAGLYWSGDATWWQPKQASRVAQQSNARETPPSGVAQPQPLPHALVYSLGVMALQKPEPLPADTRAKALVLLETILGPLQAALLALAIRRKFMR